MKIALNILNGLVNAIGGPSMLKFLVRRILAAIPVLFAIMVVTFGLTRIMPGGPFDAVGQRSMPAHIRAQLEERYGLTKSLFFDTANNANGAEAQWGEQAYVKGGFGENETDIYEELEDTGTQFRASYDLIIWDDEGGSEGEGILVYYELFPFENWVEDNADLVYTVNTLSTLSTSRIALPTGVSGYANYLTSTSTNNNSVKDLSAYREDCLPYKQYPGWALLATREECRTTSGNVSGVVNSSHDVFRIDALDSQFWNYFWGVLHFDFGPSLNISDREAGSVSEEIWRRLPVSMEIGLVSVIFGFTLGVPLGVLAAIYHNGPIDFFATFFAVLGQSTPNIVLAPILIIIVSLELQWLDPPDGSGWNDSFFTWEHLQNLILPTVALGTGMSAGIARLTRASLLQVLNEDYIRTARAKGLRERTVIYLHGLKNSLIPVATILGPLLAGILTGTFIIELIFVIPGLGKTFITAVAARDYTTIMATTLLYSVFLIIGNIMVDVIYTWLDPRIRFD